MQSIAIVEFGDTHVFKVMTTDKPVVKSGHIIIKVEATSVNPLDLKLRKGVFPHLVPQFPMVLHGDVAGTITEVAQDVVNFKVGDEVYGCAGGLLSMDGALAEFMLVDAKLMAHKPATLSFTEAAALPLVSLTAWEALVTKANVQKGQSILIHGGTGGVGHIAVQLANWLGATVFATASDSNKLTLAKQLGAHDVINYKSTRTAEYVATHTQNAGFDIVLDTVGGENIHYSIEAAKLCGQVIAILPSDTFNSVTAFAKGLTVHYVFQPLPLITGENREHYGKILQKISSIVDDGFLKPLIDIQEFTVHDIAAAHQHLESGNAIGKVVLSGF